MSGLKIEVTEIIKVPEYSSDVYGFGMLVCTDIEEKGLPNEIIAHGEYLHVTVFSDGATQLYQKLTSPQVVIIFTHPGVAFMSGKQDGVVYASVPSNLEVTQLRLVENYHDEDSDMHGINLDVLVLDEDSHENFTFCSLVIEPIETVIQ